MLYSVGEPMSSLLVVFRWATVFQFSKLTLGAWLRDEENVYIWIQFVVGHFFLIKGKFRKANAYDLRYCDLRGW
jgi:hypothetical protein